MTQYSILGDRLMVKSMSKLILTAIYLAGVFCTQGVSAAESKWEVNGYIENQTRNRFHGVGLSKSRTTLQTEFHRNFGRVGIFKNFSFSGTLRGTYDAVYEFNDGEFGDEAGGALLMDGGILGTGVPYGGSPIALPGVGGAFMTGANDGLITLGSAVHSNHANGVPGLQLAVPVRPCDEDSRGCIDGYLDFDKQELASPEFNDRADVIREAYFTGTIPLSNGDQIDVSLGRQQVIWGRTDLFRVLDVINPVDFSRNNIYDELEDIRIPMGILTTEYRWGATDTFDDLNLQFLWKWEKFRPNNLGQGGSPNAIIDAGSFFRAMNNCWDNGCTVGNFALGPGVLAPVNFGPGILGIRQANLPGWEIEETDIGARLEGVYKGVGFSFNALYYRSHFPVLRGNIPSTDPFSADPFTGTVVDHPFLVAFDIDFPRIGLLGGSADFYVEKIKSAFRVEVAWTTGEEFANTIEPDLFSESDVLRYVIGWDRPTFIRFLNKNRAFLLSAQLFGQHLLDHESIKTGFGTIGIPDYEDSWTATFLFKGWWKNDRLSPQVLSAYDFRSQSLVTEPTVDWLITDNWRLTFGANIKFGGAETFDDNRTAVPFVNIGGPTGSVGALTGYEPLGRFRSGPIGMAHNEDEVFATLRYRF